MRNSKYYWEMERRVGELREQIRGLQETQAQQLEQQSRINQTIYQELATCREPAPILLVRVLKWELGVYLRKKSKT